MWREVLWRDMWRYPSRFFLIRSGANDRNEMHEVFLISFHQDLELRTSTSKIFEGYYKSGARAFTNNSEVALVRRSRPSS